MNYTVTYYDDAVQAAIMAMPVTLQARYICLTKRMAIYGANLGKPHTEAFGGGLFELRLKGAEGIARVFYCTMLGQKTCCIVSSRSRRRTRCMSAGSQKKE